MATFQGILLDLYKLTRNKPCLLQKKKTFFMGKFPEKYKRISIMFMKRVLFNFSFTLNQIKIFIYLFHVTIRKYTKK